MRTTLNIDDDLAASLREEARLQNVPLKQVVNDALRRGLSQTANGDRPPFRVRPISTGLRPDSDPKYYKRILEEEDIQHYWDVLNRSLEEHGQ